MSRHRIVRSMNYSDEYDGYDDVYGHSVEDDYSMSPSDAAFMYDRDSRQPAQFSAFLTTEEDIQEEEDEGVMAEGAGGGRKDSFVRPPLSDLDEARLRSCRDEVQGVVGDSLPDSTLDETILRCQFDVARTLDALLQSPKAASQQCAAAAAAAMETSLPKTKLAAKHEGTDDFEILPSNSDNISKQVKQVNVADQSKRRMSTAERITASVLPDKRVQSKISNQIPIDIVEIKVPLTNGTVFSPSRASGFSSLNALKMKHKLQSTSVETSRTPEKLTNLDIVEEKVVVNHVAIAKSALESIRVCSSSTEDASSADCGKVSSDSAPRSVCTPGRNSSLAALAKRCRNPSDRRQPPIFFLDDALPQNSSVVSNNSDSLPLEFEKMSVDETKELTKPVNCSENETEPNVKGAVLIDLMAALRSPSDERQPALDEPDSSLSPQSNLHFKSEDIENNIFNNFVRVKSEFQTISCSPFGEIICKTFVNDCKEFVFAPEALDSEIQRFAFDVLSPDDEILKFRKNWGYSSN